MAPAAISAKPPITTSRFVVAAPARPAASANGVVSPSGIPRIRSRTIVLPAKCLSGW